MFDKEGNILPQGDIVPELDDAFMAELLDKEIARKKDYTFPQEVYDEIDRVFGDGDKVMRQARAESEDDKTIKQTRRDTEYLDAVNRGDMETAQRMVDEAAREAGHKYHLYHGTNAYFTEFDLRKFGGRNGKGEGYGIYLAANREISAPYGKYVIDSYVKFNRLAEGRRKTLTFAEVKKLVKQSCEVEAKRAVEDGEYDSKIEALRDTWVSNYVNTYQYSSMAQIYEDVAQMLWKDNDNDGDLINEVMTSSGAHYDYKNALNFYENILTPVTGIDGFHYVWGNKDGSGVQNDIYLAFKSEQIKSADSVTYDDKGNVIPLSERFNESNPDIRYQKRTETTTNRELLANALESTIDTSTEDGAAEFEVLKKYKASLDEVEKLESERSELVERGMELQRKKGKTEE
jgi:hypothetical protein